MVNAYDAVAEGEGIGVKGDHKTVDTTKTAAGGSGDALHGAQAGRKDSSGLSLDGKGDPPRESACKCPVGSAAAP